MGRRIKYISASQAVSVAAAADNFVNMSTINPTLNQAANAYRNTIASVAGTNPFVNALTCLVVGQIIQSEINKMAPNARARVGSLGVKL